MYNKEKITNANSRFSSYDMIQKCNAGDKV